MSWVVRLVLCILAIICLLFAAFGNHLTLGDNTINLGWLGLALFVTASLPLPERRV